MNLDNALAACNGALEIFTAELYPEKWAATQLQVAMYWSNKGAANREANLDKAAKACQDALTVYEPKHFTVEYATVIVTMGHISGDAGIGESQGEFGASDRVL